MVHTGTDPGPHLEPSLRPTDLLANVLHGHDAAEGLARVCVGGTGPSPGRPQYLDLHSAGLGLGAVMRCLDGLDLLDHGRAARPDRRIGVLLWGQGKVMGQAYRRDTGSGQSRGWGLDRALFRLAMDV